MNILRHLRVLLFGYKNDTSGPWGYASLPEYSTEEQASWEFTTDRGDLGISLRQANQYRPKGKPRLSDVELGKSSEKLEEVRQLVEQLNAKLEAMYTYDNIIAKINIEKHLRS